MAEATTAGIIVTVAIFGFIVFLFVLIVICCLVSRRNGTYQPRYYGGYGGFGGYGGYGGYGPYGPYGGYGYGGYGHSVSPGFVISTPIQNPPPASPAAIQVNPRTPAVNTPRTTPQRTPRTTPRTTPTKTPTKKTRKISDADD